MVRFKNRYLTFALANGKDITHPLNFTSVDLYNEIIEAVNYVHGDVGSSAIKPGLIVKYCNELTKVGIIRVRHGPHKIILSALPFIREIRKIPLTVHLLYIGATLLHCYKVLLKYQQVEFDKIALKPETEEVINILKSKLLTLEGFNDINATLKKQITN